MKIEWKEDNFELDGGEEEIKTAESADERLDSLEKYNDEMARDAVGSLFDTGEIEPVEEEPPRRRVPPRAAYRSKAERTPGPRVQDLIDENTEESVPARRDRTRDANPVPRPAVKVLSPYKDSRHAARPSVSRHEHDDIYDEDVDVEEEMDAFRSRYKPAPKRTESVPRSKREARSAASYRYDRLNYGEDGDASDAERVPLMRVIYIGSVVILLAITVFFAYRVSDLSNDLAEANAKIAAAPEEGGFDVTIGQERLTELQDEVDRLRAENERLTDAAYMPQFGPDTTPGPSGLTNPGTENGTSNTAETAAPPSENQTYTAQSGDSLSKIAMKFYGSQKPELIQKIKEANNKTEDGIQLGETLIIPAQ